MAPGDTDADERTYRLMTTITDPDAAPAAELAQLYTQRWEIETAFDELKTHQRGPRLVLRSKMPDGVIQEVYGYLCVHYAIRWLMHSAATDYGHDPDRLSFTRSLRAARRTHRKPPRFFPLTSSATRTKASPPRSFTNCSPRAAAAPIRESSNARCPATSSNTTTTATHRPSTAAQSSALK